MKKKRRTIQVLFAMGAAVGGLSCEGTIEDVAKLVGEDGANDAISLSNGTELVNFGSLVVGKESKELEIPINNTGTEKLYLHSMSGLEEDASYKVTSDNCPYGSELAIGATCQLKVIFTPQTQGSINRTIIINYDRKKGNRALRSTIGLTGRGVPDTGIDASADLIITTDDTSFGDLVYDFQTDEKMLLVRNKSAKTLFLSAPAHSNSDHFLLASNDCPVGGEGLSAGQSCRLQVQFTPLEEGGFEYRLAISYGDAAGTSEFSANISLFGSGIEASQIGNSAIAVTPAEFDFGAIAVAAASDLQTFELKNKSDVGIFIKSIQEDSSHFVIDGSDCPISPLELAAKATCKVHVKAKPFLSGKHFAVISSHYGLLQGKYEFSTSIKVSVTGVGDLSFAGINSATATTNTVTLAWTPQSMAVAYYIYQVAGGIATQIGFVSAPASSHTITGLSPNTSYTYRVRAANALYIPDGNTKDVAVTTKQLGSFSTIPNLSAAEGATALSSSLSCSDSYGNLPTYAVTSQSDSDANCTISSGKVQCSPLYKAGHGSWSSNIVVGCSLNGSSLTQGFTLTVTDTNRAPSLSGVANQAIVALQAISATDLSDANSGGDTDSDGDSLTYTCTIQGDAVSSFTTATACGSGSAPTIVASTGLVSWTTLSSHANPQTEVYTVTVTASDGQTPPLTHSTTFTVTLTPAIPLLTTISDQVFPSNEATVGALLSIDLNNEQGSVNNDSGMTYTCTVTNWAVSNQDCDTVLGATVINSTTGVLAWTPTIAQIGTYNFTITGTNAVGSDTESFTVNVKPAIYETNLSVHLDPTFANLTGFPGAASQSTYYDLLGAADGTLVGTAASFWIGNGTAATSPYLLDLPGVDQGVDLGSTVLDATNGFMTSFWLNPDDRAGAGHVLLASGGGAAGGVLLRQSPVMPGYVEWMVGSQQPTSSYVQIIAQQNPLAYWRMDESAGALADSSNAASFGSGVASGGGVTYSEAGAFGAANTSIRFDGSSFAIADSDNLTFGDGSVDTPFSVSFWIKPDASQSSDVNVINKLNEYTVQVKQADLTLRIQLHDPTGPAGSWRGFPALTAGVWQHVALVYAGGGTSDAINRIAAYYNGVEVTSTGAWVPGAYSAMQNSANDLKIGGGYKGWLDEVALFDYSLSRIDVEEQYRAAMGTLKAYPNEVYRAQPKAYWRFNDSSASANILRDYSDNHMDASAFGTLTRVSSKTTAMGNALDFGGGGGAVIPKSSALDFASSSLLSPFSVAFWAKTANTGATQNILVRVGSYSIAIQPDGRYFFYVIGPNGNTYRYMNATPTGLFNNWHHFAFTYSGANDDSSSLRIYYDGSLISSSQGNNGSYDGQTADQNQSITIGRGSTITANQFGGMVDEYAIFDHELSAARIARMYAETNDQFCITSLPLENGTWQHIGALYEDGADSLQVYRNGSLDCATTSGSVYTPSQPLTIGKDPAGSLPWNGQLGDIVIYTTSDASAPATANEIVQNMSATAPRYFTQASANTHSVHFDGSNDYITIANSSSLFSSGSFSFGCWFQAEKTDNMTFASAWGTPGDHGFLFDVFVSQGGTRFGRSLDGLTYSNAAASSSTVAGNWVHILGTFTSGTASIYKNGRLDSTATFATGSPYPTSLPLELGRRSDNSARSFLGYMDQCALWNAALTPTQVTEIYNGGQPANLYNVTSKSSLQAWWPMGENDTYPTINDIVGNHNGTMVNMDAGDITAVAP